MPGSDECHFNVRLCERQSHKTVSTDHNFWRERRAEVVSLYFSLTPYRRLGQTRPNSKHWLVSHTGSSPSFNHCRPYLVTGPENCQLKSSFLLCAQTVVSLLQTTQTDKTRRDIYSRQQSLHQHKQNHNRLNRNRTLSFFLFTRGGCVSCLRACLGARLLLQLY